MKRDARYVLLLLAALPLYLFLGKGSFSRMRFMLPAIPFILIVGAWFFAGIMERITGLSRGKALFGGGTRADGSRADGSVGQALRICMPGNQ